MNMRSLLAAALVAVSVAHSDAAIGDPPFAIDTQDIASVPRPMPGVDEKIDDFWQTICDWVRPKLGLVIPTEKWM